MRRGVFTRLQITPELYLCISSILQKRISRADKRRPSLHCGLVPIQPPSNEARKALRENFTAALDCTPPEVEMSRANNPVPDHHVRRRNAPYNHHDDHKSVNWPFHGALASLRSTMCAITRLAGIKSFFLVLPATTTTTTTSK